MSKLLPPLLLSRFYKNLDFVLNLIRALPAYSFVSDDEQL